MRIKIIVFLAVFMVSCVRYKYLTRVETVYVEPPELPEVQCPEWETIPYEYFAHIGDPRTLRLLEAMFLNDQSMLTCIDLYRNREKKRKDKNLDD